MTLRRIFRGTAAVSLALSLRLANAAPPATPIHDRQVVDRTQRVGMLGPLHTAPDLHDLRQESLGLGILALAVISFRSAVESNRVLSRINGAARMASTVNKPTVRRDARDVFCAASSIAVRQRPAREWRWRVQGQWQRPQLP